MSALKWRVWSLQDRLAVSTVALTTLWGCPPSWGALGQLVSPWRTSFGLTTLTNHTDRIVTLEPLSQLFSTGSTVSLWILETRSCLSSLANTFTNLCGPWWSWPPERGPFSFGSWSLDTADTACRVHLAIGRTTLGSSCPCSLDDMTKSYWEDTERPAIFSV